MNTEPKTEFYIALNVMELSPRDIDYWDKCVRYKICPDLFHNHGINVHGCAGRYVTDPNIGGRPFYLFSIQRDLERPEDMQKYREVESKVQEAIKRYIKP
jgi:hypothetical protein